MGGNSSTQKQKKEYLYKYDEFSRPIGKGAFSRVYSAYREDEQGKDDNSVNLAVKVINLKNLHIKNRSKFDQRIFEELNNFQMLSNSNNKNIVKYYKVENKYNEEQQILKIEIFQERCLGSLENWLEGMEEGVSESQAKDVLIQIINGYSSLLQQGIVHRDLKPSNILFIRDKHNQQKTFKLADFGASKRIQNDLESNYLTSKIGTVPYMAPQIFMQEQYTNKCDVYSLGIILYEMLYKKHPFLHKFQQAISEYELIQRIKKQAIAFDEDIEVSQQMQNLIMSMLKFDEAERISWQELKQMHQMPYNLNINESTFLVGKSQSFISQSMKKQDEQLEKEQNFCMKAYKILCN